jgi:hypothetical protein
MRNLLLSLGLSLLLSLTAAQAEPKPVAIFNGKDLEGWVKRGGKSEYRVEDGVIVGKSADTKANTFLCPPQEFGDFEFEFEFKVDPELNSGVQFRSECFEDARTLTIGTNLVKLAPGRVHGYQSEIDNNPTLARFWTAGIYEEAARGWLAPAKNADAATREAFTAQGKRLIKVEDWNHVRIRAVGDHIQTWLNGEKRVDLRDGRTARGFIGLQVHSVKANLLDREVRWRNLKLTDLSAN